MSCCGNKPKKPNPLEKQFRSQRKKFTKTEYLLLRKIFNDLSSRSRGETMAKDDFIRFFPLTGLWGERMFGRFDLMRTENINLEEFIIGLGNSAKLSPDEQTRYLFDVYDLTSTNCITKVELLMMLYNYPQEDLQEITKDPYFKNMVNKKQQQVTEEPSFNATSQFFQSQIKDFMGSRVSNHTNQNNQQSQIKEKENNNNKTFKGEDDDDIGKEEENLPQFYLEDRNIADCAKNHKAGQRSSKFLEVQEQKKVEDLKPSDIVVFPKGQGESEVTLQRQSTNKLEKKTHTNVPAKASNVNNIIKQYCDFVFREFDTDSLSYENFSTWCIEHYTVFNIFKNTFYFGFWGEEDGTMQYTTKQLDMSGYLHKLRKRKDNKLVRYYYELRENFLIYFLEKGQKPKGMICLDGLIVKENDANEFDDNNELKKRMLGYAGFEIAHKDDYYKSKFLYCSLEERHQWISCMGDYSKYNFYDHYLIQEKIGIGRFSTVYKGKKKNPKEGEPLYYAVKVMITSKLTKEEISFISYETETMRFLQHPGIIKVDKTMQDKHNIYIITELVSGGDLFDYIHNREFLEEVEASALMKQLFATVLYIHDAGIIHRDLKPENILVVKGNEKDKEGREIAKQIKIIDFGFSKMLQVGQKCEGFCGSENYIAPEIYQNQLYNMKVDNFALGCIMFLMLRGSLPFDSLIQQEISQNTIYGKYSLVDDHWNNVSPQAKDLIAQLLKVDPDQRISTRDALQHEWIKNRKNLEQYKGKNPHNIWKNEENQSQINQSQFQ